MNKIYALHNQYLSLVVEQRNHNIPIFKYFGKRLACDDTESSLRLLDSGIEQGSHDQYVGLPVINTLDSGCFAYRNLVINNANAYPLINLQCLNVVLEYNKLHIHLKDLAETIEVEIIFSISPSGILCSQISLLALQDGIQIQNIASMLPISESLQFMQHFGGSWARELMTFKQEIPKACFSLENYRGRGSHQHFPGMLFSNHQNSVASQYVMGVHLAWSGNFEITTDHFQPGYKTISAGEGLLEGELILNEGQSYLSPELLVAISTQGENGIRAQFHEHARTLYSEIKAARPHFNTWEACYFEQSADSLELRAQLASELGIRRIMIDDGWFENRNSDQSGLGSFSIDLKKYPGGFKQIRKILEEYELELGVWVEPEMLSPDVAHNYPSNWILKNPHCDAKLARNQLAWDLSNPEVYQHIFNGLSQMLSDSQCSSIKWDMNRDRYQAMDESGKPLIRQQTLMLYRLLEEIQSKHNVEIEICSSGGARLDYGVLPYASRFWISDNNDPLDRLSKYLNASLFFPPEVLGMHIGPERSHTTGRRVSFKEGAQMALFGDAGFEIDLTDINSEQKTYLKTWIPFYTRIRELLPDCNLYRIDTADDQCAAQLVSGDQSFSLILIQQLVSHVNSYSKPLPVTGIDASKSYKVSVLSEHEPDCHLYKRLPQWMLESNQKYSGSSLLDSGLRPCTLDPGQSLLISLET